MHHLYQLYSVHEDEGDRYASLPVRKIVGREIRQAIDDDFQGLVQQASGGVWLYLRCVDHCPGSFFNQLLKLHQSLQRRSCRLTLSVSANLEELLRITRLDQMFAVVEWPVKE